MDVDVDLCLLVDCRKLPRKGKAYVVLELYFKFVVATLSCNRIRQALGSVIPCVKDL
jgi:hypothetical protein